MRKLCLIFCLAVSFTAHAQKEKIIAYIDSYKELAIAEMQRTGVPASITLAQGILESQWGESPLAKNSNNHFGIKCKAEWTGTRTYHDDDEKGECFRVYNTAEESYRDHSDFLKTRPHYAFLFTLDPADYEGWAKGLKKAGYATSPTYPQRLLKLINDYNLQQYSLTALTRNNTPATETPVQSKDLVSTNAAAPSQIMEQPATPAVQTMQESSNREPVTAELSRPAVVNTAANAVTKIVTYPSGIFTINNTRVMYAAEGTSLLSLANQYDIPLSKLIEFNDLPGMDILDADRLMFIERKPKKGAVDYHIVAKGESLHTICQLEGIRLDSLLEYNRMTRNTAITAGDKIYLRSVSTTATATTSPRFPK